VQNFFDINTIKRLMSNWNRHHLTGCRCMTEVLSADPDLLTGPDPSVDVKGVPGPLACIFFCLPWLMPVHI